MRIRPFSVAFLCLAAALLIPADLSGEAGSGERSIVMTVGENGCDFASLQEAIDAADKGCILRLVDPVHTEADIRVTNDVLLIGGGAEATILQAHAEAAASAGRIFLVEENGSLVLDGLTLRHGHPTVCPKGGGAIINRGTVWLLRCILRENRGQCGGAIVNEGTLYAFDSMFLDNEATGGHGKDGDRARGSGGALKNVKGWAFLSGCTIAGNLAKIHGGGLKGCCNGELRLVNCTISGNEATKQGGAIHTRGILEVLHCTIVDNLASAYLAWIRGIARAGGIYIDGPTVLVASILAQNDGQDAYLGEKGEILRNGFCLVGDGSIEAAWIGDPGISGLGDHGGPTWSYLPDADSSAIDAFEGGAIVVDQRGVSRPQNSGWDLGSIELEPPGGPG